MTTVLEKFGLTPVEVVTPTNLPTSQYEVNADYAIGIEVEVENAGNVNAIPRGSVWQLISDGSLRNTGVEYITTPIPARYAPQVLQQLMSQILNGDCCFSPRTSVHVHLNCQDLELHQVLDFMLLYTVYERLFYKFAGRGRIRNIYCVPITETDLMVELCEKGVGKSWLKYTGLNMCPLRTSRDDGQGYGTLEFRHMHGTFNVEKLSIWINLITKLKSFTLANDTKYIRELVSSMDDTFAFDKLLFEIFGEHAGPLKYEGIPDVATGYLCAKSAMTSVKNSARVAAQVTSESAYFKVKA